MIAKNHRLLIPVTVQDASKSYFVYVPITKCASTFVNNFLQGPDFDSDNWCFIGNQAQYDAPPRERTWHMTIIRDPIDRWVSGTVQWLSNLEHWQDMIEVVVDQIEMDDHTTPQRLFLTGMDFDRTVWIRYQPNLETHSWFLQHGWQLPVIPADRKNITQRLDIKHAVMARLDQVCRDRLRDYYYQDYELIRTTQFI